MTGGLNVTLRRIILRSLVVLASGVVVVLLSMAHTDRDVVIAQTRKPVVMTRLFT